MLNPHFKMIRGAKAKPRRERTRARYSLRQKVVLGSVRNNDYRPPPSKHPPTEPSEVVDEPFGEQLGSEICDIAGGNIGDNPWGIQVGVECHHLDLGPTPADNVGTREFVAEGPEGLVIFIW